MICRGTEVSGAFVARVRTADSSTAAPDRLITLSPRLTRLATVACIIILGLAFGLWPVLNGLPPTVESDYCYQLIAADRAVQGLGFTSLQPIAPNQPWEWRYDFGFLTQWPAGYPFLVWCVRSLSGVQTLEACRWIARFACALALVGWFLWIGKCLPRGVACRAISILGAMCAIPLPFLVNPTTDAILAAGLPWILMICHRGFSESARSAIATFAVAGFLSGLLLWIRYAALFVPLGLGAYLLLTAVRHTRPWRHAIVFAVCAAAPIAALLTVNSVFGVATPWPSRVNLGHKTGWDVSWGLVATCWDRFTGLGLEDAWSLFRPILRLWPIALAAGALAVPRCRHAMKRFLSEPAVGLSVAVAAMLLLMLVTATALFGDKFNYVALDRYYIPTRPMVVTLFFGPLLLLPSRAARTGLGAIALVGCLGVFSLEWRRFDEETSNADSEITPYGQRAICFTPGAAPLYQWLAGENSDNTIVCSNFHDYIALETGIPALPLPVDRKTLNEWAHDVARARGLTQPRVLVVMDRSNRWRSYWRPPPREWIRRLRLSDPVSVPPAVSAWVFEVPYPGDPDGVQTSGTSSPFDAGPARVSFSQSTVSAATAGSN